MPRYTKISQMTAASALDGTELFEGVQSSATVQVTAAQLAGFSPTSISASAVWATGATVYHVSLSSASVVLTMPAAADVDPWVPHIVRVTTDAVTSAETCTVSGAAISGKSDWILQNRPDHLVIFSDGSAWHADRYTAHGSNSNGSWERRMFKQECWGTISATGFTVSDNNIGTYGMSFYQAVNTGNSFARAFASPPRVYMGGANTSGASMVSMDADTITTTSFRSVVRDNSSSDFAAVAYLATGEW